MSGDLLLSTAVLQLIVDDLNVIRSEFDGADDFASDVAEATGDDQLEDEVRNFATSWNDKRSDMVDQVDNLIGQVSAIGEAFMETDSELARALEEAE